MKVTIKATRYHSEPIDTFGDDSWGAGTFTMQRNSVIHETVTVERPGFTDFRVFASSIFPYLPMECNNIESVHYVSHTPPAREK